MKLANPNDKQSFETVYKNEQGEDEYGSRTVDGHEEMVHIPTGKSNMTYWKPEKVLDPTGCKHVFHFEGRREVVCDKCGWGLTFHINSVEESEMGLFVKIPQGTFPIK